MNLALNGVISRLFLPNIEKAAGNLHSTRPLVFAAVLSLGILLAGAQGTASGQQGTFLTYTDPEYGVIMEYPEDWQPFEYEGLIVQFEHPSEEDPEFADAYVYVFIDVPLPGQRLDQHVDDYVAYLRSSFYKEFELIERSADIIDGERAVKIVYTATYEEPFVGGTVTLESKLTEVITARDNIVYVIGYESEPSVHDKYLPIATQMIESFRLDPSLIPQPVSGRYIDQATGLEIVFPEGWSGVKVTNENVTSATVLPSPLNPNLFMTVYVNDLSAISEYLEGVLSQVSPDGGSDGCKMITAAITPIDGVRAFEFVYECEKQDGFMKSKYYALATTDKLIVLLLATPSGLAYDDNVQAFEDSVATVSIPDTVDIDILLSKYVNTNMIPERVERVYTDNILGLAVEFPEAWSTFRMDIPDISTTMVYATPTDEPFNRHQALMGISVTDTSQLDEGLSGLDVASEYDCEDLSVSLFDLKGMKALERVAKCYPADGDPDRPITTGRVYYIATEDRIFQVRLEAPSESEYRANASMFERFAQSVSIPETVDVLEFFAEHAGVHISETEKQVAVVDEKSYDITYSITQNSRMRDFEFSEEDKQISFTVDGEDGTGGIVTIDPRSVLEGPYTVAIDDVVVESQIVTNKNGAMALVIPYKHSVHDVSITGTNVIPEFPMSLITLASTFVAITILLGKMKHRIFRL